MTTFPLDVASSPARAVHSLSKHQADTIVSAMVSVHGLVELERHYSCDGSLSLLFFHSTKDRTLVVDGSSKGLHIGIMEDDVLRPGTRAYRRAGEVIQALLSEFDNDAASTRQLSA